MRTYILYLYHDYVSFIGRFDVSKFYLLASMFLTPIGCSTYQDGCQDGCHNIKCSHIDITIILVANFCVFWLAIDVNKQMVLLNILNPNEMFQLSRRLPGWVPRRPSQF